MIELRPSTPDDLPMFAAMESAEDTSEFIFGWDANRHREEMNKDGVVYFSILSNDELAGFFILALEADGKTVEFRRIVVSNQHRGIGQISIAAMEDYCRTRLNRRVIWLDVIESNERGRHIYEKLGYVRFNKGDQDGKKLLFYRKDL